MIDSVYSFISFSLVGLIWTIQVVHYPSFSYVDNDHYIDFQHFHMRAITYIVMPLMLFELAFEIYRLSKLIIY